VVADKESRYERVAVRPDRPFDKEAIVYRDLSEIENLFKGGPIAYADYYILNNSTKEDVISRVEEILEKLGD
jgi:dephospho-CoA kinase